MKPFGVVLVLLLAGCWSQGDRAPWNRPNSLLSHTQGRPGWLEDALKDARGDNMRMQDDVARQGGTPVRSPRPPSPASDD